jgi:excinuclease ABC subunit C
VPICSANCVEWKRAKRILEAHPDDIDVANLLLAREGRPCFDYHVGKGPGVCIGAVDTVDYAKNVDQVERFLQGKRSGITDELKSQMKEAAADLDFERAAGSSTGSSRSQHSMYASRSCSPPM